MSPLNQLNDRQLLEIIDSQQLKKLYSLLGEGHAKKLVDEISEYLSCHFKPNHSALRLANSFSNTPTIPFYILWTVASLGTVSPLLLAIIGGGAAVATLASAPIAYRGIKDEEDEARLIMLKTLTLSVLKQEACKTLLVRHFNEAIEPGSIPPICPSEQTVDERKFYTHLQKALEKTFEIACTLFCTYFCGSYAILSAFECLALSTMLTGGLGILIALSISIVVGAYFGLQQHRVSREESYCNAWMEQADNLIENNQEQLETIKSNLGEETQIKTPLTTTIRFFSSCLEPKKDELLLDLVHAY